MDAKNTVLLLGGIIIDHYFIIERYPKAGQDTNITKAFDKIGGCALNVAISLNNLGSRPYIVSRLGTDAAGKNIDEYLKSHGMPTDCLETVADGTTGYCLTMVDPHGERTFFTSQGCQGDFSTNQIPLAVRNSVSFIYVTGYFLGKIETCKQVLLFIEEIVRHRPCTVVFDPGPLVGVMDKVCLQQIIGLTDWIIPNDHELKLIVDSLHIEGDPITWLQGHGCNHVVVKKGAKGCTVHAPSGILHIGSSKVEVKDTSGAGDSFVGGLIHALSQGLTLGDATKFACGCGAFTATVEGPHATFTERIITTFIESNKDRTLC